MTMPLKFSSDHHDLNQRSTAKVLQVGLIRKSSENPKKWYMCVIEISQAILKVFEFKVKFLRKILKIRNFANVSIIRVKQ